MLKILDVIAGIFQPAAELIDNLHTSTEEKIDAKTRMLEVQAATMSAVFDYERSNLEAQAGIVRAEANSEHWITATWRPIVMLGLFGLVMLDSFGWLPNPLSEQAWLLLQIGLGGYVVGRSAEKVIKTVKG